MKSCNNYQDILKAHCQEGHYAFQIKRCGEPDCCQSQNQVEWLPYPVPDSENPGHYKPFKDIYGPNPTEEIMPSKTNNVRKVTEEIQGCKSTTLIAQNVCHTVTCSTCKKPRCIYAKSQLSNRETNELKKILKNYHYVCGCIITPDSSF